LREQAERMERHRAEANYGMATSARPAVPMVMGPPPVPKPSAKKASQPSGGDFVNLYRSLRPSPYHGRYHGIEDSIFEKLHEIGSRDDGKCDCDFLCQLLKRIWPLRS